MGTLFLAVVAVNLLCVCTVNMGKNQAVGGSQPGILKKYFSLETPGSIQVLYVWIDGSGECLRCKTKTVYEEPKEPSDLPVWNFDGSSTNQTNPWGLERSRLSYQLQYG